MNKTAKWCIAEK